MCKIGEICSVPGSHESTPDLNRFAAHMERFFVLPQLEKDDRLIMEACGHPFEELPGKELNQFAAELDSPPIYGKGVVQHSALHKNNHQRLEAIGQIGKKSLTLCCELLPEGNRLSAVSQSLVPESEVSQQSSQIQEALGERWNEALRLPLGELSPKGDRLLESLQSIFRSSEFLETDPQIVQAGRELGTGCISRPGEAPADIHGLAARCHGFLPPPETGEDQPQVHKIRSRLAGYLHIGFGQ